jgi:hypothetical protein
MKKVIFVVVVFFSGFLSFSQKIEKKEFDKFTKENVIQTSWEQISGASGASLGNEIFISFLYQNANTYLRIKWNCNEAYSIQENADIMLLDANDSVYIFKNVMFTVAEKGKGMPFKNPFVPAGLGLDIYAVGNCKMLLNKEIISIRFYTSEGYITYDLKKKVAPIISKTYKVLFDEINE